MGQRWLNKEPAQNRSLLQMSLFGEGGAFAPGSSDVDLALQSIVSVPRMNHALANPPAIDKKRQSEGGTQPVANPSAAHQPVQMDLVDDLEAAIHGGAGEPIRRRKGDPYQEPLGPDLALNDETLFYFRKVGVRDLFAEMVLQSIRDIMYSRDEPRMEKLQRINPEEYEEMMFSAEWLSTKEGHLAIQMLYPDWDHVTIVRRIYEDPKGIISRMSAAGARRHQEAMDGFGEVPLSDDSGFAGRLETWGDADIGGDDFGYRQG